jgi:hypothetical protein
MTKEAVRPASKLTGIEPDGLAGRGERSIQACNKVTFVQPYEVLLGPRYYLGAMTMNGGERWR